MNSSDPEAQKRIAHRLRRARGQLDAVIAAVENDRPCREVVTQLSAVSSALDRAGYLIVSTAMKNCLAPAEDSTSENSTTDDDQALTSDELEKLFLMLA
ncbi:MAG: metal-sensitive transcriptional regulator [Microbacteriaceae bacterium]